MHPRMIWVIFGKDVRDAIRDARVLIAVAVPLTLGLFYGLALDDDAAAVEATIAYAAPEQTDLPEALRAVASEAIDLRTEQVADEGAVRRLIADEEADLGLVIPAGFDAAVRGGEAPRLIVVQRESGGIESRLAASLLDPALRALANERPPATIVTEVSAATDANSVFEELGIRRYSVLATVIFLVVMISMLAVPVILAEEAEKKTLDALVLIASDADVVIAKALVGLAYVLIAVALQVALTGLIPEDVVAFGGTLFLLSVSLIGFGLLLGGLFRNANQLNTWSGFLLLPFIAPVFMVGLPLPDAVETFLLLWPTSQAMRLAINGLSGEAIFPHAWLSALVIAAWGLAAYALLMRRLAAREA